MRQAMAAAPVGDDQYGEDPSVNRLQERIAELLGKEAALFVPSGTMANQIGLKILTRPGDEVVVGDEAHIVWHESGAAAANSGVQFTVVGRGGLFTADDFRAACKPPGHIVFPPTTLVAVENTHNRGGGVVFPQERRRGDLRRGARARPRQLSRRRAAVQRRRGIGQSLAELAAPFDLVSVALSKGLGCPVGSLDRRPPRRHRPRPCGRGACSAARCANPASSPPPGSTRSTTISTRLAEDHANARLLAERLAGVRGVELDLATVQSNIVIFRMAEGAPDAATIVARAQGSRRAGLGLRRAHRARRHPSRRQPRPVPARRRPARAGDRERLTRPRTYPGPLPQAGRGR